MRRTTTCLRDSDVAEALWPGADLRPTRLADRTAQYLAVPSAADPRFLLPRDRRSADAVLEHFRNGGNASARRRVLLLRTALRTTGGWPLAGGLRVGGTCGDSIETWVSEAVGCETTLGIQLGPRRANRKPILQVLDEDDRPLAVGKVGSGRLTHALVEAEGAALGILADAALPGLRTPRLLHRGEFHGASVVLMTHLPLRHATSGVDDGRRTRAMVGLARGLGTRWVLPEKAPFVERLGERAASVTHPAIRAACLRWHELLVAAREPWELGCWHGDWTNWNMAALGPELLVWDWERFAVDVPLGWDALHHDLRLDIEDRDPVPDVARRLVERSARVLAPFGVDSRTAPFVAGAYLVELALRYTLDGQRDAGGRSARVEEWVLPVLEDIDGRNLR